MGKGGGFQSEGLWDMPVTSGSSTITLLSDCDRSSGRSEGPFSIPVYPKWRVTRKSQWGNRKYSNNIDERKEEVEEEK